MKKFCDYCKNEFPAEALELFNSRYFCPECLNEHTVCCSHCNERIWTEENAGSIATPLCGHCYSEYYVTCVYCDRVIRIDSAHYEDDESDEPMCEDCHMRRQDRRTIRDYYYKPIPIFYGQGPRYFGVELEVDGAGEDSAKAARVLAIANRDTIRAYCKHDGSLDDGFEIVTHPMNLAYQCEQMPWGEVLRCLRNMGYLSHQANTCGLHCHISRTAFGATRAEQEDAIGRVLFFVEKHWAELLKFSRRTARQLERWASRYGYQPDPKKLYDHATKNYGAGRYTCVNLNNEETIEFRIFRGTLKLNTLIATLQLIDRICDVAIFMSDEELEHMSWSTFVSGCQQPELVQYLKERRLYVNEPVESEVEV